MPGYHGFISYLSSSRKPMPDPSSSIAARVSEWLSQGSSVGNVQFQPVQAFPNNSQPGFDTQNTLSFTFQGEMGIDTAPLVQTLTQQLNQAFAAMPAGYMMLYQVDASPDDNSGYTQTSFDPSTGIYSGGGSPSPYTPTVSSDPLLGDKIGSPYTPTLPDSGMGDAGALALLLLTAFWLYKILKAKAVI